MGENEREIMNDEQKKSRLIQLAAEMAHAKEMPLEWIGDWQNIGKATPMKTKREIEAASKIAHAQCREWSRRIMEIVDDVQVG